METGVDALLDVGVTYIEESCDNCPPQNLHMATQVLLSFLKKLISYDDAKAQFQSILGNTVALDKINAIITITDEPIPAYSPPPESSPQNPRQKSRAWTAAEDQRLLAGIYKYGFESWNPVANFVGNGRTRSQCSQRWTRGLNPKISKCAWNAEEEAKLVRLVQQYGDKSWTKIASELGNRSDVQCRYKFQQLKKDSMSNDAANQQVRSPYDMSQHTPQDSVNQTMMHSPANVGPMPNGMHNSVGMPQQGNPSQYPQSPHINQPQMQMGQANPFQMMQNRMQQAQDQHAMQQFQNMTNSMQNMMMQNSAMQQTQMMQNQMQNQMQQMQFMQMQQFQMMQNQMQQMHHQQNQQMAQGMSQQNNAQKAKKPRQSKSQPHMAPPQQQQQMQPMQQQYMSPQGMPNTQMSQIQNTPQQAQPQQQQMPQQNQQQPMFPPAQQTQQIDYQQNQQSQTKQEFPITFKKETSTDGGLPDDFFDLSIHFPKIDALWYSEM